MMMMEMASVMEWMGYLPVAFGIFGVGGRFDFSKQSSENRFGLDAAQRTQGLNLFNRFAVPGHQAAATQLQRFNPFGRSDAERRLTDPNTGLFGNTRPQVGRLLDLANSRFSAQNAARGQLLPENRSNIIGQATRDVATTLLPQAQQNQQFLRNLASQSALARIAALQQQGGIFGRTFTGGSGGSQGFAIGVEGKAKAGP